MTPAPVRFSGHRSKFKLKEKDGSKSTSEEDTSYMESALSQYCHDHHPDRMDLTVFTEGFFMKCGHPRGLDNEESKCITMPNTAQTLLG